MKIAETQTPQDFESAVKIAKSIAKTNSYPADPDDKIANLYFIQQAFLLANHEMHEARAAIVDANLKREAWRKLYVAAAKCLGLDVLTD